MNNPLFNRRLFLRSLGASLALPTLESFGTDLSTPSTRLAYLYFPNGTATGSWEPEHVDAQGKLQKLNAWMSPLETHKSELIVTRKLWTPRGNGHGAGTATWLTGGRFDGRTNDAGGISVDQIAGRHLAESTPIPSLELSTAGEGSFAGSLPRNCLSWTARDIPAARETVPRMVFDKLFRRADEGFLNKSVIDLVLDQSKSLKARASQSDRRKIDEYLDAVRTMEKRLEFAESQADRIKSDRALTDTLQRPAPGIPANHQEYVQQMLELLALAFWSGATRVSTFMLDHGQSNRYFDFLPGVKGTWHALSHWKDASGRTEDDDGVTSWSNTRSKREQYNEVTRWHHAQLAFLLQRLKKLQDADGTPVLDRSLIVYGSSIADGHEHAAKDLPVLIAGGREKLKTGRYLKPARDTSMSRLHLSMLMHLGVPVHRFAETQDPLTGL